MSKILTEGLKYLDMEDQVFPIVGIDQYASKIGEDDDLVTINFMAKSKAVASDLVEWFEKGYSWVIDAEASPGEVTPGKYYVFVEIDRRIDCPKQIMEMLDDLETLTGFKDTDWKLRINDSVYDASEKILKDNIQISPHLYRITHEESLNEWRQIAGIQTISSYNDDEEMKAIKRQAGIF